MDYPLLTTEDADIAVPLKLPARAESLRKRLLTHGFTEEFFGEDRPPATHYHLGDEASGFYAQFLAPLMGSEHDRKGRSKSTIEVGGVTSERLRHIELLLHDPWTVEFESGGIAATIQIANPVCFLAQKVLIHQKRDQDERAKDILYMHDTLELFGERIEQLRDLWQQRVAPQLSARRAQKTVRGAVDSLFGSLTDDIRRAARISTERRLTAEAIRETCEYGFRQVFR